MAQDTVITCGDCGQEQKGVRRDAKRCRPCALLHQLSYVAGKFKRARTCACGTKFRPIHPKAMHQCAACRVPTRGQVPGLCLLCKREDNLLAVPPVPVCMPCAMGTETQGRVIAALTRGQRDRKDAHAPAH